MKIFVTKRKYLLAVLSVITLVVISSMGGWFTDRDSFNGIRQRETQDLVPGNSSFTNYHTYNTSELTSIPRILHQTWDKQLVPKDFREWIKSWMRLHPRWEYYFWTEADVRLLLVQHYPDYVSMYDGYKGSIFRSDAMRYFVLYHYGGVYADLDVEALQPMDTLINSHQCLLSYENYEHAYFLYHQYTPVVMTTVMACTPQHPLFKQLISSLLGSSTFTDVLYATGPFFLNSVYLSHIRSLENREPNNAIKVLHPKYLLPTFDPMLKMRIMATCSRHSGRDLSGREKRICDWHKAHAWRNEPQKEAYTNHHWFHVIGKPSSWKQKDTFHIDTLAPHRKYLTHLITGDVRTISGNHKSD